MQHSKEFNKNIIKNKLKSHFSNDSLSPFTKNKFEKALQHPNNSSRLCMAAVFARRILRPLHTSGMGYVVVLLLSIGITAIIGSYSDINIDPIDEITQFAPQSHPADFELGGDPTALTDILHELIPTINFMAHIPPDLLSQYSVQNGRLFYWQGANGVHIQLIPSHQLSTENNNASLFMVELNDKSSKKFPKNNITRKMAAKAGKEKRVKTWRDGKVGYALVQMLANKITIQGDDSFIYQ